MAYLYLSFSKLCVPEAEKVQCVSVQWLQWREDVIFHMVTNRWAVLWWRLHTWCMAVAVLMSCLASRAECWHRIQGAAHSLHGRYMSSLQVLSSQQVSELMELLNPGNECSHHGTGACGLRSSQQPVQESPLLHSSISTHWWLCACAVCLLQSSCSFKIWSLGHFFSRREAVGSLSL